MSHHSGTGWASMGLYAPACSFRQSSLGRNCSTSKCCHLQRMTHRCGTHGTSMDQPSSLSSHYLKSLRHNSNMQQTRFHSNIPAILAIAHGHATTCGACPTILARVGPAWVCMHLRAVFASPALGA
eukprot:320865_1